MLSHWLLTCINLRSIKDDYGIVLDDIACHSDSVTGRFEECGFATDNDCTNAEAVFLNCSIESAPVEVFTFKLLSSDGEESADGSGLLIAYSGDEDEVSLNFSKLL